MKMKMMSQQFQFHFLGNPCYYHENSWNNSKSHDNADVTFNQKIVVLSYSKHHYINLHAPQDSVCTFSIQASILTTACLVLKYVNSLHQVLNFATD